MCKHNTIAIYAVWVANELAACYTLDFLFIMCLDRHCFGHERNLRLIGQRFKWAASGLNLIQLGIGSKIALTCFDWEFRIV